MNPLSFNMYMVSVNGRSITLRAWRRHNWHSSFLHIRNAETDYHRLEHQLRGRPVPLGAVLCNTEQVAEHDSLLGADSWRSPLCRQLYYLTVHDMNQALRAHGEFWIVRDHDDGCALAMKFLEQIQNAPCHLSIKISCGLISQ